MADATSLIQRMALPFEDGRPSILALVRASAAARAQGTTEVDQGLPDDDDEDGDDEKGRIRFVAGAVDVLFGGPDPTTKQTKARALVAALTKLLRHPSPEAFAALYKLLKRGRASAIVDETLERIAPELEQHRATLAAVARRLIEESQDVDPVKMGVALLGISGDANDETLLLRHWSV